MSGLSSARALAKAVHAALSADVAVKGALGQPARLYDQVPEDPIFPYLTYGGLKSEDIGGDDTVLFAHTMSLHVWSRYGGRSEVMQILDAVSRALQAQNLSLDSGHLVSARIVFTDIFKAPDGQTMHGLVRFHAVIQE